MKTSKYLLLSLALAPTFFALGGIKLIEPLDGTVVSTVGAELREFLDLSTAERRLYYEDLDKRGGNRSPIGVADVISQ